MEASYNWTKLIQIQVFLEHFKIKVNLPVFASVGIARVVSVSRLPECRVCDEMIPAPCCRLSADLPPHSLHPSHNCLLYCSM